MDSDSPARIAIAVVRRGGMVLIGRRPEGGVLAGFWEFPGGKVRPGEPAADAAVRECLEETGLRIRPERQRRVVEHAYDHGTVRLHFIDAVPVDPEEKPALPFRWVKIDELDQYEFPPANRLVLESLTNDAWRPASD